MAASVCIFTRSVPRHSGRALDDVYVKVRLTFQHFRSSVAFVAFVWFAALTALGSDSPSIGIAVPGGGSSNEVFLVNNATTNKLSSQPSKNGTIAGLVESNGLYRIDIEMEPAANAVPPGSSKVERPQETVPASMNRPIDMASMLLIYAEFTGAELDIGEGVRQVPGYMPLKSPPPMTRIQVVDLLDELLLKAGVVVTHPDAKHAVFGLKH